VKRTLLLGAVYYGLFTPFGLLLRIIRDPLARRWSLRKRSYWVTFRSSPDA
jgi:hypothetical protein